MNKNIKLLAALVAAMSLASCGGEGNSTNNNGNGGTSITNPWWSTEGTLSFDEDGNVEFEEEVELSLQTVVAGEDLGAFNSIINDFNDEFEGQIYVNAVSTNQSAFEDTIATLIKNETNAPDIFMSHQKAHKWFADNKLVQPFDEAIEASGLEFNILNYVNNLGGLSNLGYEDVQFQIPIDAQSMVILYNKSVLEELNKDLPTTYDELLDVCAAYKTKYSADSHRAISMPMDEVFFNNYVFNTALAQNGFEFYDQDTLKVNWTGADNLAAYNQTAGVFNTLVNSGYMNYNETGTVGQNRFFENKTLFLFCLPWNVNSIITAYASQNQINVESAKDNFIGGHSMANLFAVNEASTTQDAIFGDSHAFLMSKTVTDINKKVACLIFAKWFTENGKAGAEWAEAGHITASHTIANSTDYTSNTFVSNFINAFYLDTNTFQTVGNNKYYSDLIRILNSASTKVVNGSAVEATLKSEQETMNGIIEFDEF